MRFEEAVEKFQPLSPYERGLVAGIYRFAWMKDGAYYVGTTGSLLGDGIARAISESRRESQGTAVTGDPLSPPATLLVKLGSALVHAEELIEPGAHEFDLAAFKSMAQDPEVVAWLEAMGR